MGDYTAYNAGLPCRNPSCKSHGKPHPFCKCYGSLAEGGEVDFCSQNRAHNPNCEYFAEGGEATPGFIPDSEFQAAPEHPPGFIPDDQFQPADQDESASHVPGFIPDDKFVGADDPTYTLPTSLGDAMGRVMHGGLLQAQPYIPPDNGQISQDALNQVKADREREATVGSFLTGSGAVSLAGKAAEAIPGVAKLAELGRLGTIGAGAIKSAISNGLIQGADEVSKWMLGQGDPQDPVGAALAHTGAAALIGGGLGGFGTAVGEGASSGLKKLAESKVGGKLTSLLAGFGAAAQGSPLEQEAFEKTIGSEGASFDLYKKGQEAFDSILGKGIKKGATALGPSAGATAGQLIMGTPGAVIGGLAGKALAKPIGSVLEKIAGPAAKKYVAPITLKILSAGETSGVLDALNHAESIAKGYDMISHGVDSLFKGSINAGIRAYGSEKDRKKLDDYISSGGINQDIQQGIYDQNDAATPMGFAEGGDVARAPEQQAHGVATHYPEQNILMTAAKGRISNYLSSLRPQSNQAKLAFDDKPDNREQKKTYHRALDIAMKPLTVLDELKRGTIEPEHLKHFNSMYPELSSLVHKKMVEKITQAQLDGHKPPYKVRQGLSMFLGTPLSGELTPQSIQAAQAVFAQGKQQQPSQPAKTGAKNPSKLSKSDQAYLTGSQALQRRSQKV